MCVFAVLFFRSKYCVCDRYIPDVTGFIKMCLFLSFTFLLFHIFASSFIIDIFVSEYKFCFFQEKTYKLSIIWVIHITVTFSARSESITGKASFCRHTHIYRYLLKNLKHDKKCTKLYKYKVLSESLLLKGKLKRFLLM